MLGHLQLAEMALLVKEGGHMLHAAEEMLLLVINQETLPYL